MTKKRSYYPLVYICSNIGEGGADPERMKDFCRKAFDEGYIPLSGELAIYSLIDKTDRGNRGLVYGTDLILMGKCDELWIVGDAASARVAVVADVAEKRKRKIRWFNADFEEVETLDHDFSNRIW